MEQTTNGRGVVQPQTVWPTLNMKQQQLVLQTIVSICQQMVSQYQEENNDEFGKQPERPNATTQ
jgi:hypothetical protein